jgi:hypothetical protein
MSARRTDDYTTSLSGCQYPDTAKAGELAALPGPLTCAVAASFAYSASEYAMSSRPGNRTGAWVQL